MNNLIDTNNVDFLDKHIGGNNDDNLQNFNNQKNIIDNKKNDYTMMIDLHNNIKRNKNENNEYIERLDNEQHTSVYRVNNFPTYVDDVNYSNPLIYPKNYDPYFEYLFKKNINPINTQVVKKKEYLNIDSANRNTTATVNISKYLSVKDNGLVFKNNSNTFRIYFETPIDINNEEFKLDEFIILRGFKAYILYYENLNFFFTSGSNTVIIDIKPNYSIPISYINVTINIEGVGSTDTNKYWKNIPYELINDIHKVFIKNTNNGTRLAFDLPINFYSTNPNDNILMSSCKITFNCLGNYPINLINANTPITTTNLANYLIVADVQENYLDVLLTNTININDNIPLDGYWENDSFFTGKNIQIGKISGFTEGFNSSNNFSIFLNKTYKNVAEIKIISSVIPNVQKNIIGELTTVENSNLASNNFFMGKNLSNLNNTNNLFYIETTNNKFYWENILDLGIYSIELESGNYSYNVLKNLIEFKVSKVKRIPIYPNEYLSEYNEIQVNFNTEINKAEFVLFDNYNLPNSLTQLVDISTPNQNIFQIKIFCPYHNLKPNDKVYISNSIDYFVIDKKYINDPNGHKVSNVYDDNYFEIIISNINTIDNVGDTKGGFSLKLKKKAIFRLFFNFTDTFGQLMGFKFVGLEYSITNYSQQINDYILTNKEQYYYDISTVLIVNNNIEPQNLITDFSSELYTYFLLLIENLNNNNNPNGPSYFYKFLIDKPPNTYLFNTFVNSPVYFNPPIKSLNELKLTLVYPNGGLVNMGNLNYSLTFEITTINNLPENTNVNTNMSRI